MVTVTVSSSIPRNVCIGVGPSNLSMVIGTFEFLNLTSSLCRCATPSLLIIHCIASATAVKIFGADLRPKESAASTYTISSHFIPKRWQSSGCIGTILYALLMSTLLAGFAGPA